jgi:hypothetical protein
MTRLHSVLVVIALLAAPLALLVRGVVCDPAQCSCMMVCPVQASHSQPLCGAAKHAPMCGTHQGHHALDYGFIAPIAPTMLSAQIPVTIPGFSWEFVATLAQSAISGFVSAPFEPPRS